ncbi:MAG: hypothetical protein P8Z67_10030, partial [Gammaproteobacteria bacterium]
LLADPKLIYLDEATSGLDPGLEKKMMHTLRKMADEGRTIMLITHATDNIVQTDHVAFISQGRLVYFGPSQEALDFFEVEEFADIYEKIQGSGEAWREVYEEKKPEKYHQYVETRLENAKALPQFELPKIRYGINDFFRQMTILTQRSRHFRPGSFSESRGCLTARPEMKWFCHNWPIVRYVHYPYERSQEQDMRSIRPITENEIDETTAIRPKGRNHPTQYRSAGRTKCPQENSCPGQLYPGATTPYLSAADPGRA